MGGAGLRRFPSERVPRQVIRTGMAELKQTASLLASTRIRRPAGGRQKAIELDPRWQQDLQRLVEPLTRGDPPSPLRWSCKSVRKLAAQLNRAGHNRNRQGVAELLQARDYSLQANRKTLEGAQHCHRDARFACLHERVEQYLSRGQPVISVDTKKKERVGDFKNNGREPRPKGQRQKVCVYDLKIKELGKVAPYGSHDLAQNTAWVSIGVDHDTAAFAVESIRRWWNSRWGSLAIRRPSNC